MALLLLLLRMVMMHPPWCYCCLSGAPSAYCLVCLQVPALGRNFSEIGWFPFHHTVEDLYGALAQYYDVQYLSLRTAV